MGGINTIMREPNGYGCSEVVIAIVLKWLIDTLRDGNTIYCTVIAAMSNHDDTKEFAIFPLT